VGGGEAEGGGDDEGVVEVLVVRRSGLMEGRKEGLPGLMAYCTENNLTVPCGWVAGHVAHYFVGPCFKTIQTNGVETIP
jgi:hypothetical protein